MLTAHDVATIRAAEQAAREQLPPGTLMDRAAAALAAAVRRVLARTGRPAYGRRVVVLVGPGDNGGDALLAGALLARRGARVDALLVAGRAHERGLAALRASGGGVGAEPAAALAAADVVVDGMLGIGGRPGLQGAAVALVRALDALPQRPPVVAVDLPSGLDAASGTLTGSHLRADLTVTFGTRKPCLLLPPAAAAAGEVELAELGVDFGPGHEVERLEADELARLWPVPGAHDDKYRRGVVGVVAGGPTYTGAALLCTGAAVRSGAGMVRYVGPGAATDLVRAHWPEVVPGAGRVQAWVLGPGLDADAQDGQRAATEQALAGDLPCVVDAGALAAVRPGRFAPTLLTPHAGELARLLSALDRPTERPDVEADPAAHVRRAAEVTGVTVLLKGSVTLVAAPGRPLRSCPEGPAWLATAGSGDVLAGIAGTLLATGLDPLDAGPLAVAAHGRAGVIASGGGPVSAGTLLAAVPDAVRSLLAR